MHMLVKGNVAAVKTFPSAAVRQLSYNVSQPKLGNAILGSQSSQRIAAAPALDFPGQPCIMAFAAILERGVL